MLFDASGDGEVLEVVKGDGRKCDQGVLIWFGLDEKSSLHFRLSGVAVTKSMTSHFRIRRLASRVVFPFVQLHVYTSTTMTLCPAEIDTLYGGPYLTSGQNKNFFKNFWNSRDRVKIKIILLSIIII